MLAIGFSFSRPDTVEFNALLSLDADLERSAGDRDGHDTGAGEANIFIGTSDAVSTFDAVKDRFPADVAWRAGFRDVDADECTPLAPAGLTFAVR